MAWMILRLDLKPLDAMISTRLWMSLTILGCKLKALDATNSSGLWLTWTTLGHKLKALNVMNTSGLWMTLIVWVRTQGSKCYQHLRVSNDMNDSGSHELKAPDAMNNSRLWMMWTIMSHEHKTLVVINRSRLWMTSITPSCLLRALMLGTAQGCRWHEQLWVMSSRL